MTLRSTTRAFRVAVTVSNTLQVSGVRHYDSVSAHTTAWSAPEVQPVFPELRKPRRPELHPSGASLSAVPGLRSLGLPPDGPPLERQQQAGDGQLPGAVRQLNCLWALRLPWGAASLSHVFGRIWGRKEEAQSKSPCCQAINLDFQQPKCLLGRLPSTESSEASLSRALGQILNGPPRLRLCSGQHVRNQPACSMTQSPILRSGCPSACPGQPPCHRPPATIQA